MVRTPFYPQSYGKWIMISNLTISYTDDNLSVVLSTDVSSGSNLPYNLASLFARVIEDSTANPEKVVEQLKEELEYD